MLGYVTNTHVITDVYQKIQIHAQEAKVKIEPSEDDRTKLVFFEKKSRPYEVAVADDTLTIKPTKAKWYNFLRIGIDRSRITLLVPKSSLAGLSVKSNVGCVELCSIACSGAIEVHTNTGKVVLNDCVAPDIFVRTNTGCVCGKLPSNVVFTVRTNTGRIETPKAPIGEVIGGRCEVKTNTGSVKFE